MVADDALTKLPATSGEEMGRIPLHFFWVCETSTGMGKHGRCDALNKAIGNTLSELRRHARLNAFADVFVSALTFSDGARWHIASPEPLERLRWTSMRCDGAVDLGRALRVLAGAFAAAPLMCREYPPYTILTSLRDPTDDWETGLRVFLSQPWAQRSHRIAFGLNEYAPYDVLQQFSVDCGHASLLAGAPVTLAHVEDLIEKMPQVIIEHVNRRFLGSA